MKKPYTSLFFASVLVAFGSFNSPVKAEKLGGSYKELSLKNPSFEKLKPTNTDFSPKGVHVTDHLGLKPGEAAITIPGWTISSEKDYAGVSATDTFNNQTDGFAFVDLNSVGVFQSDEMKGSFGSLKKDRVLLLSLETYSFRNHNMADYTVSFILDGKEFKKAPIQIQSVREGYETAYFSHKITSSASRLAVKLRVENVRGSIGQHRFDNVSVKSFKSNKLPPAMKEIYVSPNGKGSAGTKEVPFGSPTEAREALRLMNTLGTLPKGGVTVYLRGGHYQMGSPIALGPAESGEKGKPVVFKNYSGEQVTLDASLNIKATSFKKVTDKKELERLCPSARGQVYSAKVEGAYPIGSIKNQHHAEASLFIDGVAMQRARFPNTRGFAHVNKVLQKEAKSGRGTKAKPLGAQFTLLETPAASFEAWEKELNSTSTTVFAQGYLDSYWAYRNFRVHSVDASAKAVRLTDRTNYGLYQRVPKRIFFRNLLCELDQPGEWYMDHSTNVLYLIPHKEITPKTSIRVSAGKGIWKVNGANHTRLEGITLTGSQCAENAVLIEAGNHNVIAGCTMHNMAGGAVAIFGGKNNGVTGCDIYNVDVHLRLFSESASSTSIPISHNFATNCHFAQTNPAEFKGGIRIEGSGTRFANNLIHNFKNRAIVYKGNEHLIENNEIFNVGFEQGDGGAIYTGAEMWGYGNVIRNNFIHHIMNTPGLLERSGILIDDRSAGPTMTQNVFYKAGYRAISLNGSAAAVVEKNLMVEGNIGLVQSGSNAQWAFDRQQFYDEGQIKRGEKGDYIGRLEKVVGPNGWNQSLWSEKYPLFKKVMDQTGLNGRFWPIENTIRKNAFVTMRKEFSLRNVPEEMVKIEDSYTWKPEALKDLSVLDCGIVDEAHAKEFGIEFDKIGLIVDDYRKSVPDKAVYRKKVKEHFKDRPSFQSRAYYDPKTVNDLIYFNSAELFVK